MPAGAANHLPRGKTRITIRPISKFQISFVSFVPFVYFVFLFSLARPNFQISFVSFVPIVYFVFRFSPFGCALSPAVLNRKQSLMWYNQP